MTSLFSRFNLPDMVSRKSKSYVPKNFTQRIRQIRKDRSWTRKQLAVAIGVTPNAVRAWERGVGEPTELTLWKVQKAFPDLFQDVA